MSDLKTFADRVARAASRAEHLREAINWMEPTSRDTVLREPSINVSQLVGNGVNGYWQAMELISAEMSIIAEDTARETLEKAKKELAEIEDMFARFTEQENAP
ncbi:hypothetical protein CFBP5507_07965 [Agrobacterium salinitolerans]|uniref:Uncharacterized protein n=1 Tax=Agrobacterium salinitolerans TaxID=1183413 RepID=A0A4Z1RDY8_9HYPH|nr:hypothetical protein [Agrobacterium salinitolerans]UYZ06197.1 hypothetical protein CFBP5507_07965 [Agrobacterium salinitolerans]